MSLLEEEGETIPATVRKAGMLTPYALITRYPGIVRPVTDREHEEAVEIAEAVIEWAGERL